MARVDALSIKLEPLLTSNDKLAEEYGKVIENLQTRSLAFQLKNQNLSGNPNAGSVEAKRFANCSANDYGTARGHGYADKVGALPVTIPINDNKEWIEEIEAKDLEMYGVGGLIERRTANHERAMERYFDTKFFATAVNAGTALTVEGTPTIDAEIEQAIEAVETVKNDYVDGVNRDEIVVICSPATYGALRNKVNQIFNSNDLGAVRSYEGGLFNNARVFSSVRLPQGVDYVVMHDGAVAQPIRTSIYNPKPIPLSDAVAMGIFAYSGTTAVEPDLIFYKGTPVSA